MRARSTSPKRRVGRRCETGFGVRKAFPMVLNFWARACAALLPQSQWMGSSSLMEPSYTRMFSTQFLGSMSARRTVVILEAAMFITL